MGDLFRIDIPKGRGSEQAIQLATDEIICQIAAMLPEKYHGVYKEHNRLREILNKGG